MTIKNANTDVGDYLNPTVCVIGGGIAGLTLAWQLLQLKKDISVAVLEGSRPWKDYTRNCDDKKALYAGEGRGWFEQTRIRVGDTWQHETDFPIRPYGADHQVPAERERVLGGTAGVHWSMARPQDPIDIEGRPNYPRWPVTMVDLHTYYGQASKLCNLVGSYPANFTAEYWRDVLLQAGVVIVEIPKVDGFDIAMYQVLGEDYRNFATREFDDHQTIESSKIDVILNAHLNEIVYDANGHVKELIVRTMNDDGPAKATDKKITVDAKFYVLACGAVENARQLLLAGVPNDMIGRCFMCHPYSQGYTAVTITADPYRIVGAPFLMQGTTPEGPWKDQRTGVSFSGRFIPNRSVVESGIGRAWFWYPSGECYIEQAPNPDSRVTLSQTQRDGVFGQPAPIINWLVTQQEEQTYKLTTDALRAGLEKPFLVGQVSVQPWDEVKYYLVPNGHHMGTTRMSSNADEGVVDKDLKVHSFDNLFVLGSSVFPSGGISNPTFTIIALAMRLAAHLAPHC